MIDEKIGQHTPRYGNSGYKRRDSDFYATPSWVTEILVPYIPKRYYVIWEPAYGEGHIGKVLDENDKFVFGTDINHKNENYQIDFISSDAIKFCKHRLPITSPVAIVTNPPYSLASEFVAHAIELTKPTHGFVAMLLNNNWDTAKGNSRFTSLPCFDKKIVITKRIRWIEGSTGSPRENHAWYIWDHNRCEYPITNPGFPTIHYWRGE